MKLSINIKGNPSSREVWGLGVGKPSLFLSYETLLQIQNPGRKAIYKPSSDSYRFRTPRNLKGVSYVKKIPWVSSRCLYPIRASAFICPHLLGPVLIYICCPTLNINKMSLSQNCTSFGGMLCFPSTVWWSWPLPAGTSSSCAALSNATFSDITSVVLNQQ